MKNAFYVFLLVIATFSSAWSYTIFRVATESVAETPVKAKEMAILVAEEQAFHLLLEKITAPEDALKMPELTASEIVNMVETVSLEEERTSDTTYKAYVTVKFYPSAIADYLKKYNIPHLTQLPPETLIIPLFSINPAFPAIGAEPDNPFWQVLQRTGLNDFFVYRTLSLLSEGEATPTAETVTKGQIQELNKVYKTGQVVFLNVYKDGDIFIVNTKTLPNNSALPEISLTLRSRNTNLDTVATKILERVFATMEENWKKANMNLLANSKKIEVTAPIQQLSDWNNLRMQLDTMPFIEQYTTKSLRKDKVLLDIYFQDSFSELQRKIKTKGMELIEQGDSLILQQQPKNEPSVLNALSEEISAEPVDLLKGI